MSNRPVHFEIHASDPETSIAFYRQLFGWRFDRYPMPMPYWGVVTGDDKTPGINGGLIQRMGPPPVDGAPVNSWVVTVDVADIDTAFAKALKLGGKVALPKQAIPMTGWVAYVKDPDGNVIGLYQNDTGAR